jgi:hypothetical protein
MCSLKKFLVLIAVLILCINICKAQNHYLEETHDHTSEEMTTQEETPLHVELEEHELPLSLQQARQEELEQEESDILSSFNTQSTVETLGQPKEETTSLALKLSASLKTIVTDNQKENRCMKYIYEFPCGSFTFLSKFVSKCKPVKKCSKTVGSL